MGAWNIFRIAGDICHLLSKCILIFSIHCNRSAEGVSLITQGLYVIVFTTRYTDLFMPQVPWNFIFKIVYFLTSFYTIAIMQWVYPRSREREISWKLGAIILAGSLVLSPFVMMIFDRSWSVHTWLWDFSQILESICVLPQLLLLRQTTIPTVIDSFYLLALGSYRALYLVNWFIREAEMNGSKPNAVSVIFGIIQTALYADFAWVYFTRQRVKLRNGGIVDADDMRRGWLLSRIFGNKHMNVEPDEDEESAPALGGDGERRNGGRPKWGARGISVSADDGILETERANREHDEAIEAGSVDPDAKMKDPDELARVLDDDEDSPLPSGHTNGQEWRD